MASDAVAVRDSIFPGALLVFKDQQEHMWVEAVALTVLEDGGWSFDAVSSQYEMLRLNLKTDDFEYVTCTSDIPRPAVELDKAGEHVMFFEDGPLGRLPEEAEIDEWMTAAFDERARAPLRGGGPKADGPKACGKRGAGVVKPTVPLLPTLRHRITGKKEHSFIYGTKEGLEALRLRGRAAGSSDPNYVYVVTRADSTLGIGSVRVPSSRATFLGDFCLDYVDEALSPSVIVLERIPLARLAGYEQDMIEDFKLYISSHQETPRLGTPRQPAEHEFAAEGLALMKGANRFADIDDVRILALNHNAGGYRVRDFRDFAATAKSAEITGWPIQGLRTVQRCLDYCIAQTGGGFTARAQAFMAQAKLGFGDGHMTEYALIGRCLEMALTFDQVHLYNQAHIELLMRRFQLIEEKYRHRLPSLDGKAGFDPEGDSGLYLGLGPGASFGRSSVCVCPALATYIGEELTKEAAILKGKIKSHELREQMKKLAGGHNKGSKE
jgi:hypothetical protein